MLLTSYSGRRRFSNPNYTRDIIFFTPITLNKLVCVSMDSCACRLSAMCLSSWSSPTVTFPLTCFRHSMLNLNLLVLHRFVNRLAGGGHGGQEGQLVNQQSDQQKAAWRTRRTISNTTSLHRPAPVLLIYRLAAFTSIDESKANGPASVLPWFRCQRGIGTSRYDS